MPVIQRPAPASRPAPVARVPSAAPRVTAPAPRAAAPAPRAAASVARPAPAAAAKPVAAPVTGHPQVHPTSATAQKLQVAISALQDCLASLTGGGAAPKGPSVPAASPANSPRPAVAPASAPRAQAGVSARPSLAARPAPAPAAAPIAAPEVQPGDDLSSLNRAQLVALAAQYGVEATGLKAEDLRKAISDAMGGGEAPVAEEASAEGEPALDMDPITVAQAETLMNILAENNDKYGPLIDPNGTDPGCLKCGGDCMRCPNPEGYETPAQQIAACHQAVHADLGIEEPQYQ